MRQYFSWEYLILDKKQYSSTPNEKILFCLEGEIPG